MIKLVESYGYRIVSRFLPTITASAKPCNCLFGVLWCLCLSFWCWCGSDCITVACICPIGGCS